MVRLRPDDALSFVARLFEAAGASADNADTVASVLVRAEARGQTSQGVMRVSSYLAAIAKGAVDPAAKPTYIIKSPRVSVLDGARAFGAVTGTLAMTDCIDRAAQEGIAVSSVRNSSHFGAAGAYAELAANRGHIGLVMSSGPWADGYVAPWGGFKPMFDTNPIAIAFPCDDPPTIVLDMATTQVARGTITLHAKEGRPIPLGWGLDEHGQPTTDAAQVLSGSLVPLGGAKGFGLVLAVDILCAVLSGGQYPNPTCSTHLFICIDPEAFGVSSMRDQVEAAKAWITSQETIDGIDEIRLPGERGWRAERAAYSSGLEVSESTWSDLQAASGQLNVPLPQLLN